MRRSQEQLFNSLPREAQENEIWNMDQPLKIWSWLKYFMTGTPEIDAQLIMKEFKNDHYNFNLTPILIDALESWLEVEPFSLSFHHISIADKEYHPRQRWNRAQYIGSILIGNVGRKRLNRFAGELLIPQEELSEILNTSRFYGKSIKYEIPLLAKLFEVPHDRMMSRVEPLIAKQEKENLSGLIRIKQPQHPKQKQVTILDKYSLKKYI